MYRIAGETCPEQRIFLCRQYLIHGLDLRGRFCREKWNTPAEPTINQTLIDEMAFGGGGRRSIQHVDQRVFEKLALVKVWRVRPTGYWSPEENSREAPRAIFPADWPRVHGEQAQTMGDGETESAAQPALSRM